MKKILLIINAVTVSFCINLNASEYSFRKYSHVKEFYKDISEQAIQISKKYNLPAASVLAIAGLESGYGSGYVAQISGNILSLGAFKGDKELLALYLPYSKSQKKILFDSREIAKQTKDDLTYKLREKSLKRDYRPYPYAGTTKNLSLLKYNKYLREKAHKECLNDFATRWIVANSNIKAFRDARIYLDDLVKKEGVKVLLLESTNKDFTNKIGGIPNSFNYRQTWPKKVKLIMDKVGLVELVNDMVSKKLSFEEAWKKK